jgi:serine/threonine protein kinase
MSELHQNGEVVRSRYQIINVLGEGGIGITYSAQDLQTGDRVALKALSFRRMNNWKILELFEREAKVLAQLNHPAIASYLDYFQIDTESDRGFYIVQELVEGRSLSQAIADGWHGSEADVQEIALQVLEILIYLHDLKPPVIHRDIKPQNLIMQTDGKIMLVDFGAVQDTYRNTQIGGSTVVGTYGYMPPEQFRGKAVPATDLYALGATILFLLTGRSPADLPELKLKINFRSSVNITEHFANWLDKMLEPAMEDRFSSARQALKSLQTPVQATSYSDEDIQQILKQANYQPSTRTSYNLANTLASNYARPAAAYQYPKPLGSRINLHKSEELLKIDIPAAGVTGEGASLLFFSLFWNGFLIVWTSMTLRAGIFALFSIPFWVIGIGLTYVGLTVVFGKVSIVISDRTFRIDWDILGAKRHVQGKTQDLRQVEMKSSYEVNGQPVMQLCLNQGIYIHKFGSGLTRPEKEWLTQEINDFLNLWRSRH